MTELVTVQLLASLILLAGVALLVVVVQVVRTSTENDGLTKQNDLLRRQIKALSKNLESVATETNVVMPTQKLRAGIQPAQREIGASSLRAMRRF